MRIMPYKKFNYLYITFLSSVAIIASLVSLEHAVHIQLYIMKKIYI